MAGAFSDLHKAVTELFQAKARSERPFTFLEVLPIVAATPREGSGRKGKGKVLL